MAARVHSPAEREAKVKEGRARERGRFGLESREEVSFSYLNLQHFGIYTAISV